MMRRFRWKLSNTSGEVVPGNILSTLDPAVARKNPLREDETRVIRKAKGLGIRKKASEVALDKGMDKGKEIVIASPRSLVPREHTVQKDNNLVRPR